MNSFLLRCAIACLSLNSFSSFAQTGAIHSDPLHPLMIIKGESLTMPVLRLSYSRPYGVKSLRDFSLGCSKPVPGGIAAAEFQAAGITGFLRYRGEVAYLISVGDFVYTGPGLLADFYPGSGQFKPWVIPGSSFYLYYFLPGKLMTHIHFENWTGLWAPSEYPKREARLSVSSHLYPRDDLGIVAGFSYAKSRQPLYSLGISIMGGQSHKAMAGFRSGPAGFWMAYSFSNGRLEFTISISTSPVFGYEPGSSLIYHLKQD